MELPTHILCLWVAILASSYFVKNEAVDENCRAMTLIPLCPPEEPPKMCPLCPEPLMFPRVCKDVEKECLGCPEGYKCVQPKNKKGKRKGWGYCCSKADLTSMDKKEEKVTEKFNLKKIRNAKKQLKEFFGDDWKLFNRKFKRILIQLKLCKSNLDKFVKQFEVVWKAYLQGAPVKVIQKALLETKWAEKNVEAAKQMAGCIKPGSDGGDKGGKGKGEKGKGRKSRRGKGKGEMGRRPEGKGRKVKKGKRGGRRGDKGKGAKEEKEKENGRMMRHGKGKGEHGKEEEKVHEKDKGEKKNEKEEGRKGHGKEDKVHGKEGKGGTRNGKNKGENKQKEKGETEHGNDEGTGEHGKNENEHGKKKGEKKYEKEEGEKRHGKEHKEYGKEEGEGEHEKKMGENRNEEENGEKRRGVKASKH